MPNHHHKMAAFSLALPAYLLYGPLFMIRRQLDVIFLSVQVDDSPNPLQFSQVFNLIPDGGSYSVCVHLRYPPLHEPLLISANFSFNDVFRLNYGA